MERLKNHKHLNIRTFLRYSVVGVSGTIVDFGTLLLLVEVFGADPVYANIISVTLAIFNNFIWNRYWTFKERQASFHKQLGQFVIVSLVGLLINTLLLPVFIHFGVWYVFAKVVIIGIVLIWNFLGNALWTFGK